MKYVKDSPIELGRKLRELRKSAGMTQQSLANAIGVCESRISYFERGLCMPDICYVNPLAENLKVTPSILLSYYSKEKKELYEIKFSAHSKQSVTDTRKTADCTPPESSAQPSETSAPEPVEEPAQVSEVFTPKPSIFIRLISWATIDLAESFFLIFYSLIFVHHISEITAIFFETNWSKAFQFRFLTGAGTYLLVCALLVASFHYFCKNLKTTGAFR